MDGINHNSLVFYESFYESINALQSKKEKLELLEAICEFGLYENEINFKKDTVKAIFLSIKPQLIANVKKRKNGKKGAEHGVKGGRPKKNKNQNDDNKNPLGVLYETPNVNGNVNANVNANENVNLNANINSNSNGNVSPSVDFSLDKKKL